MNNRGIYVCMFRTYKYLQQFLPINSCTNETTPLIHKSIKFVTLAPNQCNFVFKNRGYCSVVNGDDNNEGGKRKVDRKELDRVCNLIGEFFPAKHNMEEILDGSAIHLTRDLVLAVLERCGVARRPAFRFFCWAGGRKGFAHDSETYNKMMQILANTRQYETMTSVLEDMGQKGLLTFDTFRISIIGFAAGKQRNKEVGLFDLMKKYKLKVGVETINRLLDELGKAELGVEAGMLFMKLEHRFTHNRQTYAVLLSGMCTAKKVREAGEVWNLMIDKGFYPDIEAHNTMLDGLMKCKKRSDSIKLFELMKANGPSPNVRCYSMLITFLCKKRKLMSIAISYFQEMLDSDCEPDAAIYTGLIRGFVKQYKMDQVYRLLVMMKEKGYPPDAQWYDALIRLMAKHQMPDLIVQVYKKMIRDGHEPTFHTFNRMMRSFFSVKNYDMASAVWEEMKCKGCCPNENSYTLLIGGLVRLGRAVEAFKFLEEMMEKGMKAPPVDYKKFAKELSRIREPDILEELARRTKLSGKVKISNDIARLAAMTRYRGKRRPIRNYDTYG